MREKNLRSGLIELSRLLGFYTFLRLIKNLRSRNLESHGQTGEDKIISEFFLNEDFTYIEIGSGEPVLRSNSYLFYKSGKSGILVDPLRSNRILSAIIRPRDTFIQRLVGMTPGIRTFWEFQDYEYSSMDRDVVSELVKSGKAKIKSTKKVKIVTLREVVEKLSSPSMPWFLSVDVEGADFEVIKSYNFSQNRPRVICIEDHEYLKNGSSLQHDYLTNLNYKRVNQTSLSIIYFDSELIK